jgi:hypothetical protein
VAERYWLDPDEVSTGRTQLEITDWVSADGIDWGDGEIQAYMADQDRGSHPVDFRIPNRQITVPLTIKARPGAPFNTARVNLQRKVARLQQEGGWFKRTTSANTTVFADVVNATLKLGGGWGQAHRDYDLDAELRLEVIPDWYGAEVTLGDHVGIGVSELIWTETGIAGDYPGRVRIVVDEDSGASVRGLLLGVRARHYSASTTARLAYAPNTCTPLDTAFVISTNIQHQNLSTDWTPIMSTNQTGGVALTHTGTYRAWVMAGGWNDSTNPRDVQLRLVWDVGDFSLPVENAPATIASGGSYYMLDLGEVRLDRVAAGTHRWQGVIQGRGPRGAEQTIISRLWLVPVDEGYAKLSAPLSLERGLQPFSGRDEFNQSSGVLTGKSAPVGGTWVGAGDTDDFVLDTTNRVVLRTNTGDAAPGRIATLNLNMTNTVVQVDALCSTAAGLPLSWVVARYSSTTNFVRAGIRWAADSPQFFVTKTVAGVETTLANPEVSVRRGTFYTIRFAVDTAGRWQAWVFQQGGVAPPTPIASGLDAQFATGGPLANGDPGFMDRESLATASTRSYDNFAAWVPPTDAVIFPNQSAELRTEAMLREDPTGTAYGPVSRVVGDLPRIPPSGSEGRTVQFFLMPTGTEFESLPVTSTGNVSARVAYRASYLFVS